MTLSHSMASTEKVKLELTSKKSLENKKPFLSNDRKISGLQEEGGEVPQGGYQLYKRRFPGIIALVSRSNSP